MDRKVGYRCTDCRELFNDPTVETYQTGYGVFTTPPFDEVVTARCPHCGSDDIEETSLCLCGESTMNDFPVCVGCYEDIRDSYVRWREMTMNTHELSADDLNQILERIDNEL